MRTVWPLGLSAMESIYLFKNLKQNTGTFLGVGVDINSLDSYIGYYWVQ
jgi:hypothetical protein